ncbi:MAG: response regulator transcription factor [Bdellovibrionales bacterium]|nr:response regulator transcription factor [Bdellovibrionales bacterium]
MRILIVEDQPKMASFIKKGLTSHGYYVDVSETGSGAESMISETEYDLVVLDVNLPDQNGMDTARHLRRDGARMPILMLTALSTTKDKIHGLDSGADDYLTKPFDFEELLARIRALLRRNGGSETSKLRFCDIELDLVQRKVSRAQIEVTLTAKEFSLLEYFMRNPGRPITRIEISEHVWDVNFDTNTNVIDVYINMLRKKIDAPFDKKMIHTMVGFGYILKD